MWTPLLLVRLIEMVAAFGGGSADLSRGVPWLGEDPEMRPADTIALEKVQSALAASARRRAREALAAIRSSD